MKILKMAFVSFFIISANLTRCFSGEAATSISKAFLNINSHSDIQNTLLNYNPLINAPKSVKPVSLVGDEATYKLIQSIPPDYNVDPHDYDLSASIEVVKELRKIKIPYWGSYWKPRKLNGRFMVWEVNNLQYQITNQESSLYLIDLKTPIKVYFLETISANHPEITIKKCTTNKYGFYLKYENINDSPNVWQCGEYIQMDFSQGTRQDKELIDLRGIDSNEKSTPLMVNQETTSCGYKWYWIYKWDGQKWLDASAQYPGFFKTYVLNELLPNPNKKALKRPINIKEGPASGIDCAGILNAFIEISKKGGPSY